MSYCSTVTLSHLVAPYCPKATCFMSVNSLRHWAKVDGFTRPSSINLKTSGSITFDGEPAGSLDFSQLHPTLILRLNYGVEKESNLFALGDVYTNATLSITKVCTQDLH